jgi:hypothetical protein
VRHGLRQSLRYWHPNGLDVGGVGFSDRGHGEGGWGFDQEAVAGPPPVVRLKFTLPR